MHESQEGPHYSDVEEVRMALVMNGGVSLAIWMGGVTQEIHRLVNGEDAYGELAAWLQISPRVDVIAGSSAGGLNGAVLSLALAHNPQGGPTGLGLRDLWIDQGSLLKLLRSPFEPDPPSLLSGDEYFLPRIAEALSGVAHGPLRSPEDAPLDLIITTTLMEGEPSRITDDFGAPVSDVDHHGHFHFRRTDVDHFADPRISEQLALAARASASFPIAFEAAFIPLSDDDERPLHPNMAAFANFSGKSRYVIDGGVLDNKPLGPALEAITAQRADRQVRRVLAYIVPDPGTPPVLESAEAPTLGRVAVASLVDLPRAESIARELRDLRERNRRLQESQIVRGSLATEVDPSELKTLSAQLFDAYRAVRIDASCRFVAGQFDDALVALGSGGVSHRRRAELVELLRSRDLPWIPSSPPSASPFVAREDWTWGIQPVEYAVGVTRDLIGTVLGQSRLGWLDEQAPSPEEESDLLSARQFLGDMWGRAHDIANDVAELRRRYDQGFWTAQVRTVVEEHGLQDDHLLHHLAERVGGWFAGDATDTDGTAIAPREELRSAMLRIALVLTQLRAPVDTVLAAADARSRPTIEEQQRLLEFVTPGTAAQGLEPVVERLLQMHVVQSALGGDRRHVGQIVEFIQLSARVSSPFGTGPSEPAQKLTGVQLGHFGAFYKRSWRSNDWIHGRLDGITHLSRVLLDPARLRQLAAASATDDTPPSHWACERIRSIAIDDADASRSAVLTPHWDRQAVLDELEFLDDPDATTPDSLPACAAAVSRRMHLDVVVEELPHLVASVDADVENRASAGGSGPQLASAFKSARDGGTLTPGTALGLWQRHRLADERFRHESGTDLFTTTVTTVAAVGTSAANASRGGLGPLRGLVPLVRGPILLLHLMAQNQMRQSRTAVAFTTAILIGGGLTVGLALVGVDLPGLLVTLGAAATVAALLLGLLRLPVAIGIVLAIAVAAAAVWRLVTGDWPLSSVEGDDIWRVVAVLVVVLAVYVVGTVHRRRPRSAARRTAA